MNTVSMNKVMCSDGQDVIPSHTSTHKPPPACALFGDLFVYPYRRPYPHQCPHHCPVPLPHLCPFYEADGVLVIRSPVQQQLPGKAAVQAGATG